MDQLRYLHWSNPPKLEKKNARIKQPLRSPTSVWLLANSLCKVSFSCSACYHGSVTNTTHPFILLMVQKSGEKASWHGKYPHYLQGFSTIPGGQPDFFLQQSHLLTKKTTKVMKITKNQVLTNTHMTHHTCVNFSCICAKASCAASKSCGRGVVHVGGHCMEVNFAVYVG